MPNEIPEFIQKHINRWAHDRRCYWYVKSYFPSIVDDSSVNQKVDDVLADFTVKMCSCREDYRGHEGYAWTVFKNVVSDHYRSVYGKQVYPKAIVRLKKRLGAYIGRIWQLYCNDGLDPKKIWELLGVQNVKYAKIDVELIQRLIDRIETKEDFACSKKKSERATRRAIESAVADGSDDPGIYNPIRDPENNGEESVAAAEACDLMGILLKPRADVDGISNPVVNLELSDAERKFLFLYFMADMSAIDAARDSGIVTTNANRTLNKLLERIKKAFEVSGITRSDIY